MGRTGSVQRATASARRRIVGKGPGLGGVYRRTQRGGGRGRGTTKIACDSIIGYTREQDQRGF